MALPDLPSRPPALREFQQQLAQRLQQARQSPAGLSTAIAADTGQGRWLFELPQTAEVITPPAPTPVPLARPWYLGVIHHRSEITGVIDLDGFLGAPVIPWRATDRLLVLASTLSPRCAIRIARIHTVPALSQLRMLAPDPASPAWVSARLADTDGVCWSRVDVAVLLRDPAFIDIRQP